MVKYLLVLAILAYISILTSANGRIHDQIQYRRHYPERSPKNFFLCNKHEIWSACPPAVCRPKTCDDVGFPISCLDLAPGGRCPSNPRCICKENFVRDRRGVCIPIELCPPRKICKKNEVYDLCPSSCPPRTCGINDAAVSCAVSLPVGHPKCPPPACRCKDGFYRNHRGHCVRWEHCPKCRSENEIYDPCPLNCPPRRCDVNPALILCEVQPQIGDIECKPSCRCADGFLRNHIGTCIPKDKCPKCDKPNQVFDPCIRCPPKRCDVDEHLIKCATALKVGDPRCQAGCRCIDGYKLNSKGDCIPAEKCPPKCPFNEVYSDCIRNNCKPQNCSQLGFPIACPKIQPAHCKKGCVCKDGYVRNINGYCIPIEKCPSCGGDPKKKTGCGVYCNQRCRDVGKKPGACILICYENACDCRDGHYLDENTGLCVLPKQCTPQCPLNEVHSECVQGNCTPQYCSQLGFPMACPRINPAFCKKGCICKKGYARNDKGHCIPITECPKCHKPYQVFDPCIPCPPKRCDVDERLIKCATALKVGDPRCQAGCRCIDGYKMNSNGDCIPAEKCPPKCPFNEVYSDCIRNNCRPQNCSQLGFPIACPKTQPAHCKQGCVCKDGYVRNENGICIPIEKCPSCGGDPKKKTGCGVYCNQRCRDVGKKPGACILICYENACDCRDGHYLDENTGLCVLPKHCTPQCPDNEFYSHCTQANCSPQNCTQVGFPIRCSLINQKFCKKGCLCKKGYARNNKGICIPLNECPKIPTCGKDEIYEDCTYPVCRAKYCTDLGIPLNCKCKKECICKKGYLRDNRGICIPAQNCPPRCPVNEVHSECINGGCQPRNCSQYGKQVPCLKIDSKNCVAGCVCKENYLRAYNGQCVPADKCPEACNGPNEEFSKCSWNCPPQTCESLDRAYVCPIREGDRCRPMCRCKPGYFRNKRGECITEKQCRKCDKPFELYSCGGACDNVCETLDQQSQKNCPIVNIKCNEMCYCEEGYARAKNNTCIPISQCAADIRTCGKDEVYEDCTNPVCRAKYCTDLGHPLDCKSRCKKGCICKNGYVRDGRGICIPTQNCQPQCPPNERYDSCPGSTCEPQYCSQLGFPLPCSDKAANSSCPKKPGCVCIDGFVRDANGKCIPKNKCPSCGGDKKARPGCGVNCGKLCRNLGKGPSPCIKICYNNACDCIDGYFYDANQKKCVLPAQCTDICDKNEVFEDCSNPTCKAENCTELGFPLNCKKTCKKGCVCKIGFVRDANGICIPANQCPSCGGDCNARLGCSNNCNKRCPNNYINPKFCPKIACVPQLNKCECKDGFYYDINRKRCVKLEDCSPRCNEQNKEIFDPCINGGCGWKNCSQVGGPKICVQPYKCYQGCKCEEGYYRLDNGTCVLEHQCRTTKCRRPNEYYDCGSACDNVCGKLDTESKYNCPYKNIKCVPKCYCRDGFARNKHGNCIPIDQCPCKSDPKDLLKN